MDLEEGRGGLYGAAEAQGGQGVGEGKDRQKDRQIEGYGERGLAVGKGGGKVDAGM